MALDELLADRLLTYKPADKNLGIVIMDTNQYNDTVDAILRDYTTYKCVEHLPEMINNTTRSMFQYYHALLKSKSLKEEKYQTFLKKIVGYHNNQQNLEHFAASHRLPGVYMMPKLHKYPRPINNPKAWRPIIPSHRWITGPLSRIVDTILLPIVKAHTIETTADLQRGATIIKDSKSLINIVETLKIQDPDCILITSDISSLYTNIPTDTGPDVVAGMVADEHKSIVRNLLRMILKNNCFQFNGRPFIQVNGTAMGTNSAPNYANLFLIPFETRFIARYRREILFYGRYLDDIIIILSSKCNLQQFQLDFTQICPHLEFSFKYSPIEIEFLDIVFYKGHRFDRDSVLDTRVHQKSCNNYLYLPYRSQHTLHTKKSMITTELQRYIRLSSDFQHFQEIRSLFHERLLTRGYGRALLHFLFNSEAARYRNRAQLLKSQARKSDKPKTDSDQPILFFSMEFNATTQQFATQMQQHLHRVIDNCREILLLEGIPPPRTMIAWRSSPNFFRLMNTNMRDFFTAEKKAALPSATGLMASTVGH